MSVFLHKMCRDAKGSPRVPRQVLFSNRSHVKLMLRDFPGSVDDARRAFGLDPMNIKARGGRISREVFPLLRSIRQ